MKTIWMTPILGAVSVLLACSTSSPTAFAAASKLRQSFNDTDLELKSCELKVDRTVTCHMSVNNHSTDMRIEVTKGITIQDDLGNAVAAVATSEASRTSIFTLARDEQIDDQ